MTKNGVETKEEFFDEYVMQQLDNIYKKTYYRIRNREGYTFDRFIDHVAEVLKEEKENRD